MTQDYVVMDLETTGLNPKTDKIIEIGAARIREGKVRETYSTYVNPGRQLSAKVTELTGIHNEDLQDAPFIEELLNSFLEFIGQDILLGHNLIFDYSFMKRAMVNQKQTFERQGIDTLKIARKCLTDVESKNLGFLCEYYHISLSAHRALNDALATQQLYQILLKQFYEKDCHIFSPKPLIYQVKKESPLTLKQRELILKLASRYQVIVKEGHFLEPDGLCVKEETDIDRMTKNEASRLIDHLLSNYGRWSPS